MTSVFNGEEKRRLWKRERGSLSTQELLKSWYQSAKSDEPVDQLLDVYCKSWLVEDLLMKADKMTMQNSLELRVPFLDHEFVEFATALPLELKVGSCSLGYRSKAILRDYSDKLLPREIIDRPKKGFPVPANQWVTRDLKDWAEKRIDDSPLRQWVDTNSLSPTPDQTWALIILGDWLKAWA